jgi:hypothetical protein
MGMGHYSMHTIGLQYASTSSTSRYAPTAPVSIAVLIRLEFDALRQAGSVSSYRARRS